MKYWLTLVWVPESGQLVDIARFPKGAAFNGMVDGRFGVWAGRLGA